MRRRGGGRRLLAAALLAGLAGGAPPAGAETRAVEALGAVPASRGREAAQRAALYEAVRRVAEELLAAGGALEEARLEAALGEDPFPYVVRYRIVEDHGERPAVLLRDAEGGREYAVRVEVHVDSDRVRQSLERAGLLLAPAGKRRIGLRVEIVDVESYGAYRAVRTLLEELGVRSALPVELERGRVALAVEADRPADELLRALVRAAPPELRIEPLGSDGRTLRLRARFLGAAASPAPAIVDTPDRNRY